MSSKYSKLPEKTLRIKLEKFDKSFLPEAIIKEIEDTLSNYEQEKAALLALEVENFIANAKKAEKLRLEEEHKKRVDDELEADEKIFETVKREYNKIISDSDFNSVKSAFGIPLKDEYDNLIYQSLSEQFHVWMQKFSNLKFLRAKLNEEHQFTESNGFKLINTNKGMPQTFEGYEKYFFTCFRLFVDPESQKCRYESLWIVNTSDSLEEKVIPFDYKYFTWEDVPDEERYSFICEFIKLEPDSESAYKSECYLR